MLFLDLKYFLAQFDFCESFCKLMRREGEHKMMGKIVDYAINKLTIELYYVHLKDFVHCVHFIKSSS